MPYDHPAPETIGVLLARARIDRGVSQLRLAERLCAAAGVATLTRHEISRWERGERLPSGFWLGWLALVLELPLGQLEAAVAAARRRREADRTGEAATGVAPQNAAALRDVVTGTPPPDRPPGWFDPDRVPGWIQQWPGVFTRAS
jgi:transcriptional regulator with XRE-family HTH domain